ncbi:hypothetical protein E8E14_013736 [Neopestalotiopsis sp. 37M]|nr:hypothetical protein E8E14_013736 [Neopestalotiopsis sp. 37M]
MPATPKPRKRDRLKAVFRSRDDISVSPAPAHEVATQSPSHPSQTQVLLSPDSQRQETTLDSTATFDSSIYLGGNNDRRQPSRSLAHDSLWEDALSKLDKSSSMEDQSHAHSLRKFMKTQNQDLSKQIGGAGSDGIDLIEMVKRAAEARRVEAERQAWKIDFGTHTILLRDVATKIIDCLNKFKEIGDLAVQYDPVHAALPWAAFRFLLQVATINQEQTCQLLSGIDIAIQAYLRAMIYQDLYLGLPDRQDIADALRSSIIELLAAICAFMGLAVKHFSSGSVKNVAQGIFNPENAAAHQKEGLRYEKLVSILDVHTDRLNGLQSELVKVAAKITQLAEALSDEEIHGIFLWISGIPYESDLYNARRGRLEGTCEWLITHATYQQWKSSSESTTLWLHGIPGAGKTKLSTKVVDDLAPMNLPLAYFFCDRNQENRSDPLTVLYSITRQLSRFPQPQRIHECTVKAYNEKKNNGFASDKLTNEEARDLLLKLTNENSRNHYSSSPNLEIEAAHNQNDIEKLIMNRMSSSRWAAEGMSAHVREAVVRLFRKKSQGMFQWASLHIDELLEFESDQAILEWLHGLPEGLKAAYDRICDGFSTRWRIYVDRAFMWLMAPHDRQISPELLCVLVCQDVGKGFDHDAKLSPGSLLSACKNLIKVEYHSVSVRYSRKDEKQVTEACRFAHLSVQEYLETYRLNLVEAERMILEISVQFWQNVSATDNQAKQNGKDSKARNTFYDDDTSIHKQLQWLTVRPIRTFLRSADMNEANQRIWYQLLQMTKSHDIVPGIPSWRARDEDAFNKIFFHPVRGQTVLKALSSPVAVCAWFGNQAPIKFWVENGSLNSMIDRKTARELVMATYSHQRAAVCNLLLDTGTNFKDEPSYMLEMRVKDLFRPTIALTKESHSTLLRLLNQLFDDGAPANFCPSFQSIYDGTYPLEVARVLLEHGVNPNVYDGTKKTTPLMYAVSRGDRNMEMTKLLLQHGAKVNSFDDRDRTPMQYASRSFKNYETLKLLLDLGADPNAGAPKGGTPLQHVALNSSAEAVKLLLGRDARINAVPFQYGTALHAAALRGSQGKEIYELLLAHGADSSVKCEVKRYFRREVLANEVLQSVLKDEEHDEEPKDLEPNDSSDSEKDDSYTYMN